MQASYICGMGCMVCAGIEAENLGFLLNQVGPAVVLSWLRHYIMLGIYSFLSFVCKPLRGLLKGYTAQRLFDAWQWGSGQDHSYSPQGS